jgi:hypothetical protein
MSELFDFYPYSEWFRVNRACRERSLPGGDLLAAGRLPSPMNT